MSLSSETVSLAGSGLVFQNSYGAGVTDAYRANVITAENFLQSHFVNAVTISVNFDLQPLSGGTVAQNDFSVYGFSYPTLVAALASHATTPDDALAVGGLPAVDPSGGLGFELSGGEAQALGLMGPSGQPNDVSIVLSSNEPWTYGEDVVGAIEHELTEGGFGRFQSLGIGVDYYSPFDLFRFNTSGQRDYSGGADGVQTVFGLDSTHLTRLVLHNAVSLAGVNDGGDLGDWELTFTDAFGDGGGGLSAGLSATDLRVLDVLGWTPPASPLPGADDFASRFSGSTAPFGQLTLGVASTGRLELIGDRDWFQVKLTAGADYLISVFGQTDGGGSLDDPTLYVHDANGVQIAMNDDISFPDNVDSQLVLHSTTTGTYYVEAGSWSDQTTGGYTVSVIQAVSAPTSGSDFLVGAAGGSTLSAGSGNDTIVAGDAQNYLRGDDGNDVINGGAAFDDINGNQGNDTEHGNGGDDWVVGGKGDDVLYGDAGNDIVWGNLGSDTLSGGDGNDQVRGGQGNDVLDGGAGDDWLSGDRGSDTITGGAGADTFHSSSGAGLDVVTDFSLSQGDRVQLDPGTTYTVFQSGADTIVDLGNGDEVVLKNVQLATLTPGWIFVG